ncbi:MAG: hypothetical protein PVG91_07125 [Gammaproteobacteria bacterium]
MARHLPYRATTSTGNQFDFEFPLHDETVSAVTVSNLLNALLATLDREIRLVGQVGNGDVLQALSMALAVRTRILPGDPAQLDRLVHALLETALAAPVTPADGNLPPEESRGVH